jgi:hypothetical protein
MSERFPGGFITRTPPVPTLTSASGVWTVEQAMEYQKAGTWPFGGPFNYIEDVFSTYLYTGNGTTQTITNGIDLSTKGGLAWIKWRSGTTYSTRPHELFDSARGLPNALSTNATSAQANATGSLTTFNTDGFSFGGGNSGLVNYSGENYVSWTFRKQPKFFDIVTWTGNGSATQTISHNLGSAPGCIIVKGVSGATGWDVYHRSLGTSAYVQLNTTAASTTISNVWGTINSTTFTATGTLGQNDSGATYVAYLFAHDAGGFGLTGTDNVISCGSFTAGSSVDTTVSLGYEPQFLLIKASSTTGNWTMIDSMRGIPTGTMGGADDSTVSANLSNAENLQGIANLTSTGFQVNYGGANQTYIYIAIRRGPMKVPTTGTSVFKPVTRAGTGTSAYSVTGTGFSPDSIFIRSRNNAAGKNWNNFDRLRGIQNNLVFGDTSAEASNTDKVSSYDQDGYSVPATPSTTLNATGENFIDYLWKRAPSFMDVVCYTGTGTASQVLTHNLTVIPTLTIFKKRSAINPWDVVSGNTSYMQLNATNAATPDTSIAATSTTITAPLGAGNGLNASGATYVAYLFATCAGVSKVGSYTGNGSSQTIACGFTAGARFILIKCTSTTGDWYVWDTARGIVAGNDPYLGLNTYVNEVTTNDTIDPDSTGFIVNQLAATNVNVTSATYIFLAIA